ncbi:MAG: IS4 family transposase [Cytophagales bacterium]
MSKDKEAYKGIPILGQLLAHIPQHIFDKVVLQTQSDKSHRTVSTWSQFVFLAYGIVTKSGTLRGTYKNLELLGDKLCHLQMKTIPARSSLSDANWNREASVFGLLYLELYKYYQHYFSDSFVSRLVNGEISLSDVEVFDSTTVSLFKDIFKNTGRLPENGKQKGGLKAFCKITLAERIPNFICLKAAATNEKVFLSLLDLAKGTIAVFDKGFQKFSQYAKWTEQGVFYVTRPNDNIKIKIIKNLHLEDVDDVGVVQDSIIELSYYDQKAKEHLTTESRMVAYIDPETNKKLVFITNHMGIKALTVCMLYQRRWTIEPLFRQIKQNFELVYFMADSPEGIKAQIWIAMIMNLIFTVIHKKIKEAIDFATLVSIAANNMFSYVNFLGFAEDSSIVKREKDTNVGIVQLSLLNLIRGG